MGATKKNVSLPLLIFSLYQNFTIQTQTWSQVVGSTLPYHSPLENLPKTPKMPISEDFLCFHNRWSGAQTIRFLSLQPISKFVKHIKYVNFATKANPL